MLLVGGPSSVVGSKHDDWIPMLLVGGPSSVVGSKHDDWIPILLVGGPARGEYMWRKGNPYQYY